MEGKAYPGVHSDVGGGYEPSEQKVDNNYARIPMRDMMREALHCGVKLLSCSQIKSDASALFTERFECRPETVAAYRAYLAALPSAGDSVEENMKSHLRLYYSANGTMHRQGMQNPGDRSRMANKAKYIFGSKGMASDIWIYRTYLKVGKFLWLGERSLRGFAQRLEIKDWQLSAWDANASQDVVNFVSRYVHDSKVDFMGNIEPFTYFRPRGVDESSISIWAEGGNWIKSKSAAVGVALGAVTDVLKKK